MWRHFGVIMSLGNQGVFQLLKRVTFRRILAFLLLNVKLSIEKPSEGSCFGLNLIVDEIKVSSLMVVLETFFESL